jgi:protein-disulfide isomerase
MSELKIPVTKHDHIQGDEHAPITLVEYGDFECPHCGHAYPIIKAIQQQFGKQLRFIYRHFPMTQTHPNAQSAAETSEFAGANGRFWKMHDLLFENQKRLGVSLFVELAAVLGLSVPELRIALETGKFTEKVKSEFMGGVRSGVNGTPTFFVNGYRHDEAVELLPETLEGAVRESAGSRGSRR